MDQGTRKLATTLLAAASLTTAAASASARTVTLPEPSYVESGDAGQTLGTAQNAGAFPSVISGTIGTPTDADLYLFTLATAGNIQFTVTSSAGIDTALFLFDSTGKALLTNDDAASGMSLNPLLLANLTAGTYYLGISLSGNEPVNTANQLLFATGTSTSTRGPAGGVNPATEATFNGNFGFAETGAYSIGLAAVPEPSTTAALAVGTIASLVLLRRLRRQPTA